METLSFSEVCDFIQLLGVHSSFYIRLALKVLISAYIRVKVYNFLVFHLNGRLKHEVQSWKCSLILFLKEARLVECLNIECDPLFKYTCIILLMRVGPGICVQKTLSFGVSLWAWPTIHELRILRTISIYRFLRLVCL